MPLRSRPARLRPRVTGRPLVLRPSLIAATPAPLLHPGGELRSAPDRRGRLQAAPGVLPEEDAVVGLETVRRRMDYRGWRPDEKDTRCWLLDLGIRIQGSVIGNR
jgi:hypothetical protein